jgi:hypothetical protein
MSPPSAIHFAKLPDKKDPFSHGNISTVSMIDNQLSGVVDLDKDIIHEAIKRAVFESSRI